MYPKPKSAPARILQSRFVKNKTDAMKEIEAWVKKDDDPLISHEAIRVAGQLTDNVTEDRMLRAKLWELSKERYKFLSKAAYEKKIFEDRVKRKSALQQQKLSASSVSSGKHASLLEDHGNSGCGSAQNHWQNRRPAVLKQVELFTEENGKDEENTVSLQRSVWIRTKRDDVRSRIEAADTHFESSVDRDAAAATEKLSTLTAFGMQKLSSAKTASSPLPPGGQLFSTQAPLNPSNARLNGQAYAAETDEENFAAVTGSPANTWSPDHRHGSSVSARGSGCPTPALPAWRTTLRTVTPRGGKDVKCRGRTVAVVTKDPRYAQLENSLTPVRPQRHQQDVSTIITSIQSLHMPPVRAKVKAKTEVKALEYMRERGFVF